VGNASQSSPDILWAHYDFFRHKKTSYLGWQEVLSIALSFPLPASPDWLKGSASKLSLYHIY